MKKKKAGKPSGRSHQKAPSSISVSPSPGPGGEEEGSPETVLADFSRLTHLVVDTSSFILFQELGLLGPLTSHWQCSITEKVLQELERGPNPPAAKDVSGFTIEPSFTVLSAHIPDNHLDPAKKEGGHGTPRTPLSTASASTDRELLLLAERSGQALLSEDRKLLRAGEERKLLSLDTLLALVILRYLGTISRACYVQAQEYLLKRNRYSAAYLGFIEQLLLWMEKEGR
ncbi:MAG: hypothetical protein N2509_00240 [Treponemataceae bacterium]|nr:hypothetical protein [Treponemataceae bacterium]HOJ99183.1 hypothetical protein [Termitinemataceae bacterium]HOM23180.1 hypothetical protein [Termitinemataceae bacterium]HPQ00366.1 hypothetical protein [Termitinemataceae bacterium]